MAAPRMFYGNYEFVPAPIFSWNSELVRDPKQDALCIRHTLDFTGTLLYTGGNDDSFDLVYNKKLKLQAALASGKQPFLITQNGSPIVSGLYPLIQNVQFGEGVWVDRIPYTFSMIYEEDSENLGISSYNETWDYEENADRSTATASHAISAVGINTNPSGLNNAFSNAKSYVLAKKGWSNVVASTPAFVQASGTYDAYEELRTENVDVAGGSYSINEKFTLSSGTYIHTSTASLSIDDASIGTLSIDGNIKGLGRSTLAFSRALTGWKAIKPKLPLQASGYYSELEGPATLFTSHTTSYTVTRNEFDGTITYQVSYTDSPAENIPSGLQDWSINVSDQKPVRLYASFPIMERTLGNVVQDIGTSTEGTYTISGSAVGKANYPFASVLSYVQEQINLKRPLAVNYQTLRLNSKQINKEEDKNTVNFTLEWIYTVDLSQAAVDGYITIS